MARRRNYIPEEYQSITPQLTVDDAAGTIDWYKRALGAEEIGRFLDPRGKVMHADLKIGNSHILVNDVMDGSDHGNPRGSRAALWLYVENSDEVFDRAVRAGGTVQMPMADQFWGDRAGSVIDPAGYTWWIATHTEELSRTEIEQRSADFFKQATAR